MPYAINYRVTTNPHGDDACEIRFNDKLAVVLKHANGKFHVLADPNFNDLCVTAEDLQVAIESAAEKLIS